MSLADALRNDVRRHWRLKRSRLSRTVVSVRVPGRISVDEWLLHRDCSRIDCEHVVEETWIDEGEDVKRMLPLWTHIRLGVGLEYTLMKAPRGGTAAK